MDLSTRRVMSEVGPMPISMEAVWCYTDLVLSDITEDEVEDLLYFLRVLDDKFLEVQNEKLKRLRNRNPNPRSSRV